LLCILTIITPTVNNFILEANAKEFKLLSNPDFLINISFKENTNLMKIINKLNSKNIGIVSLTGYTKKNGNILPYVFNSNNSNQNLDSETNPFETTLSKNIESEFKSSFRNYVEKLKTIKEDNTVLDTFETSNSQSDLIPLDKNQIKGIKAIVNSYSIIDLDENLNLNKNFNLFLSNNLFIDSISIVTFSNQIKHIENRLKNELNSVEKINFKEQEKLIKDEIKNLEAEINNNNLVTQKTFTPNINSNENSINPLINEFTKEEKSTLESISPEEIKKIDRKIKIDEKGNSVIRLTDIDDTIGIDKEEAIIIKQAIDKVNKNRDIDKEINLLQAIMSKEFILNKRSEKDLISNLKSIIEGRVETEAFYNWRASAILFNCKFWLWWYRCAVGIKANYAVVESLASSVPVGLDTFLTGVGLKACSRISQNNDGMSCAITVSFVVSFFFGGLKNIISDGILSCKNGILVGKYFKGNYFINCYK
jgi:hypothetical protein